MGYYRDFTLHLMDKEDKERITGDDAELVISDLHSTVVYTLNAFDVRGQPMDSVTWYEFDEDMKAFSRRYPDILFCLYVEGPSIDDRYKHYFLDGKHQECPGHIVFKPFDPDKLK